MGWLSSVPYCHTGFPCWGIEIALNRKSRITTGQGYSRTVWSMHLIPRELMRIHAIIILIMDTIIIAITSSRILQVCQMALCVAVFSCWFSSFALAIVSARQRQSPHPMISLTEALQTINKVIDEIDLGTQVHHVRYIFILLSILRDLSQLCSFVCFFSIPKQIDSDIAGHVIAEEVKAEHPLPQWHSTNVDGYAVYCS